MSSRRSPPRTSSAPAIRWFVALLVLIGAACGDNEDATDGGARCVSTEVDEFPEGLLSNPESLVPTESDCAPGSLADVDLNGRWSVIGEQPFTLDHPLIREDCNEGIDIETAPFPTTLVHRDDTNLFWRTSLEQPGFTIVGAVRACAIPGSDELAVAIGQCLQEEGSEDACTVEQGRMKRFTRPPGEAEADGLELVSAWSGGPGPWPASESLNVKVASGVAFLVRFGDLRLIDVSDPAQPSDLGSLAGNNPAVDFNDVKLFQANGATYAILAGMTTPIVDPRDPTRPTIAAQLGEYSHSVFVRVDGEGRTLAYLATYGSDVPIYDISDPAAPVLVERVQLGLGAGPHDLYAEEDRLYVNASWAGFALLERSEGEWVHLGEPLPSFYSHASWVGEIGGRRIAIHGDEGADAHLRVVDVDPASPSFMTAIGSYQTRPEVSIHNMMLFGSRVYLTYYQDGARILDLSDPTRPALVAYYHTWDPATGVPGLFDGAVGLDVDLDAGLLYIADLSRGLIVLRETGASLAPTPTGRGGRSRPARSASTSRAAGGPADTP